MISIYILGIAFFAIAFLYSSVGFGGGSSYLLLLALFFVSVPFIRTTALLCNITVVSGSVLLYYRKGLLDFKKFLPFVLISIPTAFLGARFKLTERTFFIILGISLIAAAVLLLWRSLNANTNHTTKDYPPFTSWLFGGAIGFLAGLVGIGGGIFLAPVLNLMKWEKPIKIAALASFFILVNSISGLVGLYTSDNFEFNLKDSLILILAVFLGGQVGIRTSLKWFDGNKIRIITAILIIVVAVKILIDQL
ncbi:hypothetical protein SAMN03097699_2038 [Flavobacteriaceae bacterium MAR_2010_188]|nr:hypothetical protein SAMN03097699_2038 [Flavobacteriaceae bacterium MAR_2010_188]